MNLTAVNDAIASSMESAAALSRLCLEQARRIVAEQAARLSERTTEAKEVISSERSRVRAFIIRTSEELMTARHTAWQLRSHQAEARRSDAYA